LKSKPKQTLPKATNIIRKKIRITLSILEKIGQ